MKTEMKAMRPDEFEKYVLEHKIVGELGAMELVRSEPKIFSQNGERNE